MKALCIGAAAFLLFSFTPFKTIADIPPNAVASVSVVAVPSAVSSPSAVGVNSAGALRSARVAVSLADSARFDLLYENLDLQGLALSREAYHRAVLGFLTMQITGLVRNPDVLSIVDFSLPSSQKRLFVIDMLNGRLLFNTFVAHGRNSGALMATRFSNRTNSYMSSLGFYLTGDPFFGSHGYSLRLQGIERGWNDHAFNRRIIMHPADYVSEEHIQQWGYLGRSEGCPAIPEELNAPIIDEIK
ncbi:MAG TPA: murein L,D-transpeptidase catalytic domain family protein, partial [Puia sp.]|nr:murein L,D-transpeptidase catalytic domain family protein [Puia sp.]